MAETAKATTTQAARAKYVLMTARYCPSPSATALLKLGQNNHRNSVPGETYVRVYLFLQHTVIFAARTNEREKDVPVSQFSALSVQVQNYGVAVSAVLLLCLVHSADKTRLSRIVGVGGVN